VEWNILSEITVEMHVAVETDTTDDPMAHAGVFPKGVAEFTDFLVL